MYQPYYTNDFLRGFVSSLTIVGAVVLGFYYPVQSAVSLMHSFMLGLLLYIYAPSLFTSIAQRIVNGALCEFASRQKFECMAKNLIYPEPTTLYDRLLNGVRNVNLVKLLPIISGAYNIYMLSKGFTQNLPDERSFQEEQEHIAARRHLRGQSRPHPQETPQTISPQTTPTETPQTPQTTPTETPQTPQTTPTETPQTIPTETAQHTHTETPQTIPTETAQHTHTETPQTIPTETAQHTHTETPQPQTTQPTETNTEGVIPTMDLNEIMKVMAGNGPLMTSMATTAFKLANEFVGTLENPKV